MYTFQEWLEFWDRQTAATHQLQMGQNPLPAGFSGYTDEKQNKYINALVAGARLARHYKIPLRGLERVAKDSMGKNHTKEEFVTRMKAPLKVAPVMANYYMAFVEKHKEIR